MTAELGKPTIIYDGECRFCIARVANVRKLDKKEQFEYKPRQEAGLEDRFPQIKNIDLEDGVLLVDGGRLFVGADAAVEVARRLPFTNLVAWLYHLPVIKQIVRGVYRVIANNRKRLGQTCHEGRCELPH